MFKSCRMECSRVFSSYNDRSQGLIPEKERKRSSSASGRSEVQGLKRVVVPEVCGWYFIVVGKQERDSSYSRGIRRLLRIHGDRPCVASLSLLRRRHFRHRNHRRKADRRCCRPPNVGDENDVVERSLDQKLLLERENASCIIAESGVKNAE